MCLYSIPLLIHRVIVVNMVKVVQCRYNHAPQAQVVCIHMIMQWHTIRKFIAQLLFIAKLSLKCGGYTIRILRYIEVQWCSYKSELEIVFYYMYKPQKGYLKYFQA